MGWHAVEHAKPYTGLPSRRTLDQHICRSDSRELQVDPLLCCSSQMQGPGSKCRAGGCQGKRGYHPLCKSHLHHLDYDALRSSGLALMIIRMLRPAASEPLEAFPWALNLVAYFACRGMALKAGLEAAKATIGQQQAVEGHERAATHKMLGALSMQARETEARALLQHEAAMAAMLAAQQAQVMIMPNFVSYPLTHPDLSSRRLYRTNIRSTAACFQEKLPICFQIDGNIISRQDSMWGRR